MNGTAAVVVHNILPVVEPLSESKTNEGYLFSGSGSSNPAVFGKIYSFLVPTTYILYVCTISSGVFKKVFVGWSVDLWCMIYYYRVKSIALIDLIKLIDKTSSSLELCCMFYVCIFTSRSTMIRRHEESLLPPFFFFPSPVGLC